MWVSFISQPRLSLIGLLTTEIYYRTGTTGNTKTQTHRLKLILSSDTISGRVKKKDYKEHIQVSDWQTDRQTGRENCQTERNTGRQRDRHTEADRQTNRQSEIDRERERGKEKQRHR